MELDHAEMQNYYTPNRTLCWSRKSISFATSKKNFKRFQSFPLTETVTIDGTGIKSFDFVSSERNAML